MQPHNIYTFTLPTPPSVNAIYANSRRGRLKSRAYKAWLAQAGFALRSQQPPELKGKVVVTYSFGTPKPKRVRDCANFEKALSDLLVKHRVIEDDSLIARNTQQWHEDFHDENIEGVLITIQPLADYLKNNKGLRA